MGLQRKSGRVWSQYTSASIFCEKLRSGDAGERDSVSGERGSGSGVSGGCDVVVLASLAVFQKVVLGY